ncbi:hypothetical protein ACFQ36_23220, partial [Arthrobacter sp. GCM10027362]
PEAGAKHRIEAALRRLRATFRDAGRRHDRAVVVLAQADMFDPAPPAAAADDPEQVFGFRAIVRALAEDSEWLQAYGRDAAADRLQRTTVAGSANAASYVRFTVAPNGPKNAGSRR